MADAHAGLAVSREFAAMGGTIEVQLVNSPFVLEVVVAAGRDARGEREEVQIGRAHV